MGKIIDWSKPLSEEDAAWAEQFPSLNGGMLAANREQFPPEPEDSLEGEDDEFVPYDKWTVAELTTEAKRRNSEEGKALPVTGTKPVLVKALEDDDAAAA